MAQSRLKQYFPLIRSREELLAQIHGRENLEELFDSWREEQQEEFLDFCTGVRGVRLLYDSFFKEIMDPDRTPERLEQLLSLLLKCRVKILAVLPLDSSRIAGESSLLIMDIVVELEDGSIINLEVQKLGYRFPGERAACYSSDLLLRQYKRGRNKRGKKFSYKDIKGVYTIVLFENSPSEFGWYPDQYLHFFTQKSDTGIELELLQKYLFVPLDIFKKILQNENRRIENELEAWLVFLGMDDPEMIVRLITAYPEFRPLYEQVYEICRNVEDVMGLFSDELRILDENTVQLMIDEMQETIDRQREELQRQTEEAVVRENELRQRQSEEIQRQKEEARKREEELQRRITRLEQQITRKDQ